MTRSSFHDTQSQSLVSYCVTNLEKLPVKPIRETRVKSNFISLVTIETLNLLMLQYLGGLLSRSLQLHEVEVGLRGESHIAMASLSK
jgi:hypothetical protein